MENLSVILRNPTTKKVGIGAAFVAGASGLIWGLNHFIGTPLAAGAKSFNTAFKKSYAEETAKRKSKAESKEKTA